jgi:hypothetical protein
MFLPEVVKIDFENTKRASDVKAVKIRHQIFLAPGIPPSPNTSKIICHTLN